MPLTTETFYPQNQQAWRNWLIDNHQKKDAIWVVFYKKDTQIPTISWSVAVDEALCFGWIDSTKKSIDKEQYIQYFCKRKAKSNWSKINKEKIDNLTANGVMYPAGIKSVELAKQNGSWTILDSVEALITPPELEAAFIDYPKAQRFYESLSNSAKKTLLYWIVSAKRTETKQKRILEIVRNAQENKKPIQFR